MLSDGLELRQCIAWSPGAAAIIVRFRAAREGARSQLRWLGLAAIPLRLPLFAASVAAVLNQEVIAFVMVCLFIAILPLGIGLSIDGITSTTWTSSSARRPPGHC